MSTAEKPKSDGLGSEAENTSRAGLAAMIRESEWIAYINLASSVVTLLTVGGALIVGSLAGKALDLLGVLHSPWSYVCGLGLFLLAAGCIRLFFVRPRRTTASVAVGDPTKNRLAAFSQHADDWDPVLKDFGLDVLGFFRSRDDPTVPVPPMALAQALRARLPNVSEMSEAEILKLVREVQLRGYSPGLARGDLGYFVPEDHISFKLASHLVEKEAIGAAAAALVRSNSVVSLDGGSTTLPIAQSILTRVDCGDLFGVTLVTNSYPIANSVSTLAERRGWSDDECPISVVVPAGQLRPNTQAISPLPADVRLPVTSLEAIFGVLGRADICFVGANGLRADEGITMPTSYELDIKDLMLNSADRQYIVADPSKFGVRNPVIIRNWDSSVTLLTYRPSQTNREFDRVMNLPGRTVRIVFADSCEPESDGLPTCS